VSRDQAFWLGMMCGAMIAAPSVGWLVNMATDNYARVEWCERIAKSSAPLTFAECVPQQYEVPKP